ncbi:MAG: hypothetical protein IM600_17345 [Bacteroidetes bacterium]|nr:hypothetical protein [Bacteroidota bacterium]MCA6445197.1 hypothetical protein [Bacteroidota bacterium]
MKLIIKLSFFYTLLIFVGCKKDPRINPNIEVKCEDLPASPSTGWITTSRNPLLNFQKAIFDLNDNNIIYALSDDTSSNRLLLIKFNRLNGIKQILAKNVLSKPSINNKGWLTFCDINFTVFKIKSNGDSLTQLTQPNTALSSIWNPADNTIFINNNINLKTYKISNTGAMLDTIKNIYNLIQKKDSLMLFIESNSINGSSVQTICLFNTNSNIKTSIKTIPFKVADDIVSGCFLNTTNETIFYHNGFGLYKINTKGNSEIKIINSCPRNKYFHFSISPFSQKLMATQIIAYPTSQSTLYSEYNIVEFNQDGTNETKINIP